MIYAPIQRWGLGDIIWEQTLVRKLAQGNPIVWGVEPQFLEGLLRAYPGIHFFPQLVDDKNYLRMEGHEEHGIKYLPLRFADTICNVEYKDCMKSKYMLYNMDYRCWKEKAMWHRDTVKENELFMLLGCDKGPYNFANNIFGSQSQLTVNIELESDLPIVQMRTIPGYSLFDWARVMENAEAIHTVSSSINYILEMINVKAEEVHLYPRKPIEVDFRNIEYILEKHKYIRHI